MISRYQFFPESAYKLPDKPNVVRLNLSNALVGDEGLCELAKMRELGELILSGTNVTDKGIKLIAANRTITVLSLDRLPITDADRRGVSDPLSAMLIPANGDPLQPANCNHVLSIFDGRRRYDLTLGYKRLDKVALERSFSGAVLVCSVVLKPIAGYRSDSMLVKYVAGRRDMELWFAPVSGTSVMAPIRVSMPTLVGTLEIQADQFDSLPPLPEAPAAAAPPR